MMVKFSVIISTWKRSIELNLILDSLEKQAKSLNLYLQVIVSDSNSCDNVLQIVQNWKKKSIYLIIEHVHTENVLATKRNYGLAFAISDNIIFLDDDCVPAESFLKNCLNRIDELAYKKVFCGEVRFLPKQILESNYYYYRDSKHPRDVNNNKKLNEWTFVAMNFLISKKLVLQHNLRFNEIFVGYGAEDHDYGFQLVARGFEIIQSNQRIWHYESNGDIGKYSRKIFHFARDGMTTMKSIYGDRFTHNNVRLEKIEKIFTSYYGRILYYLFFNKYILNFLVFLLKKADSLRFLNFNLLYKYVILCSYINGIMARFKKTNKNSLRENWYR